MEQETDFKPNTRQVGGSHYREVNAAYQHWDLVADYDLDYFMGQVTKYVSRWRRKNGLLDLEKAPHYLEKLISIYQQNPRRWCTRQPGVCTHVLYDFCKAQRLTRTETMVCELAVHYVGMDDLQHMHLLLQRTIEEAKQQVAGHPATDTRRVR